MPPKKLASAGAGSADIRNFFGGNKPKLTASGSAAKAPQEDKKAKEPRPSVKKRVIDSSEDEEHFFPVKNTNNKKKKIDSDNEHEVKTDNTKAQAKQAKAKPVPKPKPELKPVDVASIYGNIPIHQSDRLTATKRKKPPKEEHEDEDFEATLEELDKAGGIQHKKPRPGPRTPSKATRTSPRKQAHKDQARISESHSHVESIVGKLRAPRQITEAINGTEVVELSPVKKERKSEKAPETRPHKELSLGKRSSPRKAVSTKNSPEVVTLSPARTAVREKTPSKAAPDPTPSKKKPEAMEAKAEPTNNRTKAETEPRAKRSTPLKQKVVAADKEEQHKEGATETPGRKGANYQQYLHREGPKHLGAKPIPQGQEGCLTGLTFVVTGVLDSMEREQAKSLVREYGGKATHAVSKKTSYVLAGDVPGPAKIVKAQSFGTTVINEDDFLELIASRPGTQTEPQATKLSKGKAVASKAKSDASDAATPSQKYSPTKSPKKGNQKAESRSSIMESVQKAETNGKPGLLQPLLPFVDKYKPTSSKGIIGQQGDKSNVKKLMHWLQHWHANHSGGKKLPRPSPWAKNDDGAFFKAVLLSGPPGVGKTTTAYLVCKELGFDLVEMNASDTRSKRLLQEHVTELLSNQSISNFVHGLKGDDGRKHVLLMDEVDGMAGNEDRGGMQELIGLIKSSKVPIICTCNDRSHPKMRSLSNYCFDLRFQRPRLEQIRGAMMTVCFKEGIKIKPEALDAIILGANQDLRQVLHHLSMWSAKEKTMNHEQTQKNAKEAKKDFKMGPWDVVRSVFSSSEHKGMSLQDKSDLFFHDYSLGPLMVQENYLSVVPHAAKGDVKKTLSLVSATADSLSMGDIVDRNIRSNNAWSLLTAQAMYSSVIPGELMEGHMAAQINFPSWLGRNSRTNKIDRLLQELQVHMRLRISGGKRALNLDYGQQLRQAILSPLQQQGTEGVAPAIQVMEAYDLLREDLDSLLEITQWPGKPEPMATVDSKVKAAFTRAYNKENHMTPYAAGVGIIKNRGGASEVPAEDYLDGAEEDLLEEASGKDNNEEEEEDIAQDAMIKVKKVAPAKGRGSKTKSDAASGETSNAKIRGKGPRSNSRKAK